MINNIKMELYRMVKSKSTYIIILATAIFVMAFVKLDAMVINGENISTENTQDNSGNSVEMIHINEDDINVNTESLMIMVSSFFSGNVINMVMLIFVGLFVCGHHKSGIDKNIFGNINKKYTLFIADIVVCACFALIFIIVMFLLPFIGYQLFCNNIKDIPFGDLSAMIKFLIVYLILQISVASVMSCFVFVIRNQVIALVVALVYGSGIPYELINAVLGSVFKGFDIMKYVPIGNAINMSLNHGSWDYLRVIIVAVVFAILSVIIGTTSLEKVDVK